MKPIIFFKKQTGSPSGEQHALLNCSIKASYDVLQGGALVILLLCCTRVNAQVNHNTLQHIWEKSPPFITNYTTDDYKAALQNWCITQDNHGVIYTGNNSGILEYDGARWTLIKTPKETPVRSLAKDSKGHIYVGGIGEIGYLVPGARKGMRFQSLVDNLDSAHRDFGDVWFTYCASDTVYFICDKHILRLCNNQFKVWEGEFGFAWEINNTVYVDVRGRGLLKFSGDSFAPVKGGEEFKGKGLTALFPYDGKHLIAFGSSKEALLYDGSHLTVLKKENKKIQFNDVIYHGAKLSNGDYAFATTGSGIYLMDRQGNIKINISRREGLTSDAAYSVYEDAEGDLWVATDNGISRIELRSPLRVLNENQGMTENPFDIEYFNDKIYIATSKGLFQLDEEVHNGLPPKFALKKIPGVDNLTQDCNLAGGTLIISNYDGIFSLGRDNNLSLLYKGHTTWVEAPSLPDQRHLLFQTGGQGIGELVYSDGKWKTGKEKLEIDGAIYGAIRASNGNVFINTRRKGIYEIAWTSTAKTHSLEDAYELIYYDTTKGLSSQNIKSLEKAGNTIYASTDKAVHRYNAATRSFGRAPGVMRHLRSRKGAWVNEIVSGPGNSFWLAVYHNYQSFIFKYQHGLLKALPAAGRFSNVLVTKIYDDKKGIVLFGSNKSLILFDENRQEEFRSPFKTSISSVELGKDSLIHTRCLETAQSLTPSVSYANNDLRFEFSLPSYDLSAENQYQYMLEGFDETWSSWSGQSQVSFTNLAEGSYTFRVQAKNVYGQLSEEDRFAFSVLPPWHRTWWAYGLYGFSLIGCVALIVNWRSRELKREKIELESIIKERTEKISQQAEKLKEMDHLKSSFFANISHEFRTPLTLILAPLESELKKKSAGESKDTLLLIQRSANRLLELVNQLLDLSKLESGKMELHIRQGDLRQFLFVIASSFDSLAEYKQITFHKNLEIGDQLYWYDHDKIEKIITNLLSNAIKYTPSGQTVTISVQADNNRQLLIEVSDTGTGIPEEEQASIFSPFYQARQAAAGYQQGTGLGLSLVKELVKLYNGSISLQSRSGIGTSFSVMIPIDKEAFIPEQIVEDDPEVLFIQTGLSTSKPYIENVDHIEQSETLLIGKDSVLLAEDNADMREFMSATLQNNGFTVLTARHGEEALRLAVSFVPSLVLSDLMMPGMDGLTLTKKIKDDERTSHIPVILLTAKNEQRSKLEGLKTGADDYLTKPFSPDELLVRIRNLIAQRKKLAEKFRERIIISATPIEEASLDDKFLLKARGVVEVNIGDYLLSVEKMADEMNLSRTQLLRKMKALTGLSPSDFIKDIRLKRAADMIRQKTNTITQIGYAVGFNDQSYFAKCFRKQFGVAPSEYSHQADKKN